MEPTPATNPVAKFFGRILDYLNPSYHLRKLKEDLTIMKRSWQMRKELDFAKHDMSLQQLFRGKLFSLFMLSGPFGLVSLPLGFWAQRLTSNGIVGIVATVAITMIVTTGMYQLFWALDNKILYANKANAWEKLKELERDLWPVQWTGIKSGIVMATFSTLPGIVIAAILQSAFPKLVEVLPMNIIVLVADFLFVQGPFLRIMGDTFDKHSHVLAAKYDHVFTAG